MTNITYSLILSRAWPIVLANIAVPLLGLVDTAIIGNFGELSELGAIALGSLLFNFIYWSFGFLRMSTTGFVAQAHGAQDTAEIRAAVFRPLALSLLIGTVLVVFSGIVSDISFYLLHASEEVESAAQDYFAIRILGAPASLGLFVVLGCLVGMAENKKLLYLQLLLNITNILLDILFAGYFKMGVEGIAIGTVIAESFALLVGLIFVLGLFLKDKKDTEPLLPWLRLKNLNKLKDTLAANRDVMIRTLCLVFGFYWFVDQGAIFGDTVLAANHVLMQLVTFSAFFLDGFAFVAESLVGAAVGASAHRQMRDAIYRSSVLSFLAALFLGLIIVLFGSVAASLLTDIAAVREVVIDYRWYAAVYVVLSFAAFQLDGIFIGATLAAQMRNAALLSVCVFIITWYFTRAMNNHGLWLSMIAYVVARATALLLYRKSLYRNL